MHFEICPMCECNHLKVIEEPMMDYDPKNGRQQVIGEATVFRCPSCNWSVKVEYLYMDLGRYSTNLGSATSQGMDVQLQFQPLDRLTIDLAVGYTDAEYDETVKAGPAASARRQGR